MLAIKNRARRAVAVCVLLGILLAGCTPPGPRALLKGRKLLEKGDYTGAVAQFKTATSLLATNAQAWNYLGVAEQHAGQINAAVAAYQHALALDRDLAEAHYNLGCLWLEQNQPETAKRELTAYTLRRSHAPEGWLKLGLVQLRLRDLTAAEKSFSTARYLSPNNPEALNGLGLARMERGQPREAAGLFAAAVKAKPDYAPALLNLATVALEYLHNNALALQNYRAYLALTPRRKKWNEVNAIVNRLQPPAPPAAERHPPVENRTQRPVAPTPPTTTGIKPERTREVRPVVSPRAEETMRDNTAASARANPPSKAVEVRSKPAIAVAPNSSAPKSENRNVETGKMQLPQTNSATLPSAIARSVHITPSAPPAFPRYLFLSPAKPRPGDRQAAQTAFAQARKFQGNADWQDAMDSYREAARLDPAWFAAQYDYGVLAYSLKDYRQSLAAYEMALAIEPDSVDARYNFALTLKAAGYMIDAANELKKILASHPDEVRAHLALGNLYAQQLGDPARARAEYLKVLRLDPTSPQAPDIQFWLSANPP